jgi:serine/threonine protein kinase
MEASRTSDGPLKRRPTRLGKYEVDGVVGSGGMGTVFRAIEHNAAQAVRVVALKLVHVHLGQSSDFRRLFVNEIRLALAMHHRNIVQTFDAGQMGERYFIAMELVEGSSLRDVIDRSPRRQLPLDVALFVVMELCSALSYAHSFQPALANQPGPIIHRDISPSNVLLSTHGDVKLADFGVARTEERATQQQSLSIKGKLQYMPPEQAAGEPETRSDLFALGAVLYEMLSGRKIRESNSLRDVLEGRLALVPLHTLRADVPRELERLLVRLLQPSADERPTSAEALRQELAPILLDLQIASGAGADSHRRLSSYLAELPPKDDPADPLIEKIADALLAEAGQLQAALETAGDGREVLDAVRSERPADANRQRPTADRGAETMLGVVGRAAAAPRSLAPGRRLGLALAALLSLGLLLWLVWRDGQPIGVSGGVATEASAPLSTDGDERRPIRGSGTASDSDSKIAPADAPQVVERPASRVPNAALVLRADTEPKALPVADASLATERPDAQASPLRPTAKPPTEPPPAAEPPTATPPTATPPTATPPAARPARAGRPRRGRKGRLDINSLPWTKVFVDGRYRGNTPLEGLLLRAGRRRVRLESPRRGLSRTFVIQIRAGQTVRKLVDLRNRN